MKILPALLLLLCSNSFSFTLYAQYYIPQNKVWAMSRYVGLDFSNGAPEVIATGMQGDFCYEEGCASVSDEGANLLFYTNGTKIWTAAGTVMPNGYNLFGTTFYNTESTAQGALIVPDPGNHNRYYVFSISSLEGAQQVLFSDVVDMSLNNGMGDVDLSYSLRGGVIQNGLTEKMIAVRGCNNGIWLLVRRLNQGTYEAYPITASGLELNPSASTAGNFPNGNYGYGAMKSNNAGNMVCAYYGGLELCDFDAATGMVSNAQVLDTVTGLSSHYYGGAFSPDDSKVYVCSGYSRVIYQFDLNAANPMATKTNLGQGKLEDLKLGPDGKIYFGSGVSYNSSGSHYMSRINFPNNAGIACGFQDWVTSLSFEGITAVGAGLRAGLPAEVVMPDSRGNGKNRLDSVICRFPDALTLFASTGFTYYHWDNGSNAATRTVTQRGTYWVRYRMESCSIVQTDSFKIKGGELPALQLVYQNGILHTTHSFNSHQWYKDGQPVAGAVDSGLMVTGNGLYKVIVSNAWGCRDSATYEVNDITALPAPELTSNQIMVYPNPATRLLK